MTIVVSQIVVSEVVRCVTVSITVSVEKAAAVTARDPPATLPTAATAAGAGA